MKKNRVWVVIALLAFLIVGYFAWPYLMGKAKKEAEAKAKSFKVEKVIVSTFLFEKGEWITRGMIYLNQALPGPDLIELGKVKVHAVLEKRLHLPITLIPMADLHTIGFATHVDVRKYVALIRTLQKHDSLEILLNAEVPLKLPVVGSEVVLIKDKKMRVPTFHVPLVKVGKLVFDKRSLKQSKAHLPLFIKNLEKAELNISGAHLKVSIGGVGDIDVRQDRKLTLGPFAKDSAELKGVLTIVRPLSTAFNIVRNKDKYMAHITGKVDIVVVIRGTEIIIPYEIMEDEGVELVPSKQKIRDLKQMKFDKK